MKSVYVEEVMGNRKPGKNLNYMANRSSLQDDKPENKNKLKTTHNQPKKKILPPKPTKNPNNLDCIFLLPQLQRWELSLFLHRRLAKKEQMKHLDKPSVTNQAAG